MFGTPSANERIELVTENWNQIQESYKAQEENVRKEIYYLFHNQVENLGETLFGEEATPDDFNCFCQALNDEDQDKFL